METKNVLISMDSDCVYGCIGELESSFDEGWAVSSSEYDEFSNTSLLTLERAIA